MENRLDYPADAEAWIVHCRDQIRNWPPVVKMEIEHRVSVSCKATCPQCCADVPLDGTVGLERFVCTSCDYAGLRSWLEQNRAHKRGVCRDTVTFMPVPPWTAIR